MKLGLIGGGYWGKNLIREFNNCQALHTICDINEEALKSYNEKYPNVKTTKNWNDIINNPEIDSVCVALPAELHFKFAKEALENNKNVYVEKPITLEVKEADELVKIAKEKNKILMVGHLLHYHPAVIKIKEIIKSGKIGKIKNIIANRLSHGIFRTHENVLWSFAPHDISVILSLIGKMPKTISCFGNDLITKSIQDITNSILTFDDHEYVNINVNWLSPYKEQKMTIVGEKGMLIFDDTSKDKKLTLFEEYLTYNENNIPIPVKDKFEIVELDTSSSPLFNECLHFKQSVENNTQPITDGEEGIRVLTVLNLLQKSLSENGKKIIFQDNSPKYFKHDTAFVDDGANIGEGTKIWHYSHICKGAKIGKNCNIGQNVFIADGAVIGDNCKVQNNVSIYAGVEAGNYVFFGPSCVLTNDINPRGMYSKNGVYIKTTLEDGVTLGANCTIVCGNTIGKHSLIGAGAVVSKSVEPHSIMVGNPAKKIGTIDEKGNRQLDDIVKKNKVDTELTKNTTPSDDEKEINIPSEPKPEKNKYPSEPIFENMISKFTTPEWDVKSSEKNNSTIIEAYAMLYFLLSKKNKTKLINRMLYWYEKNNQNTPYTFNIEKGTIDDTRNSQHFLWTAKAFYHHYLLTKEKKYKKISQKIVNEVTEKNTKNNIIFNWYNCSNHECVSPKSLTCAEMLYIFDKKNYLKNTLDFYFNEMKFKKNMTCSMNDYKENSTRVLSVDHENMELAEGLFNLAEVSNNNEYYKKAIAIVIRSAKYTIDSENNLAKLQCFYFIKKYNINFEDIDILEKKVKKIYKQINKNKIPIQAYANAKNKSSANIFPYIYLCRILNEKFL